MYPQGIGQLSAPRQMPQAPQAPQAPMPQQAPMAAPMQQPQLPEHLDGIGLNLVDAQERLKDLADGQLMQYLQTGGGAPPMLVLGELNRRKRMRDKAAQPPQQTVASELMNEAMQGGIAAAVPRQGMQAGGLVAGLQRLFGRRPPAGARTEEEAIARAREQYGWSEDMDPRREYSREPAREDWDDYVTPSEPVPAPTSPTDERLRQLFAGMGDYEPPAAAEPSAPSTYTIRKGDTLSEIAQRVGVPMEVLAEANDIADPNRIREGQVLRISEEPLPPNQYLADLQANIERAEAPPPAETTAPLAVDVLGVNRVLLNGGNENQTLDQFANMWKSKYEKAEGNTFLEKLADIESSGGTNLINRNSRARGKYQWMPGTAEQYGLDWTKLDRLAREGQVDPAEEDAIRRFTADNRRTLRNKLGREPDDWELYLAHQQGATGASRVLVPMQARAPASRQEMQEGGPPAYRAQGILDYLSGRQQRTAELRREAANQSPGWFEPGGPPFGNTGYITSSGSAADVRERAAARRESGIEEQARWMEWQRRQEEERQRRLFAGMGDYEPPSAEDEGTVGRGRRTQQARADRADQGDAEPTPQATTGREGEAHRLREERIREQEAEREAERERREAEEAEKEAERQAAQDAAAEEEARRTSEADARRTIDELKRAERADINIPLMITGLAMLASKRPDFMGALGEGGVAGLEAYMKIQEREEKRAEKEADRQARIDAALLRSSGGGYDSTQVSLIQEQFDRALNLAGYGEADILRYITNPKEFEEAEYGDLNKLVALMNRRNEVERQFMLSGPRSEAGGLTPEMMAMFGFTD